MIRLERGPSWMPGPGCCAAKTKGSTFLSPVWWRECASSAPMLMSDGFKPSLLGGTGKPCSGVDGGESLAGMPAGGLPSPGLESRLRRVRC
jgi:hypothetical protein